MIKKSILISVVAIAIVGIVWSQFGGLRILSGQPFFFPNGTIEQHNITPIPTNNTQQPPQTITGLKGQISMLEKNLFDSRRALTTLGQNIFTIQAQINHFSKLLVIAQKHHMSRFETAVLNYDTLKHCSSNQTYGNTNYLTFLTHFACGHVTVFNNGTTLRQFTLIVDDNHGSGLPLNITTNKTDPVIFHSWDFNGTVPGPTLRVTVGDHVKITVINSKSSAFIHSMHMHSIHPGIMDGMMGNGGYIFPGSNFTYDFIAQPVGVYPYHCHMSPVAEHISRGLYGMLIIDPKTPRPAAHEMVMILNSFTFSYEGVNGSGHLAPTIPATMQQIRQNLTDVEEKSDENNGPDNQFYAANSMAFGYEGKHMIHLFTNTPYRIYLENMIEFDPVNSFHIHGTLGNYTSMGTLNSPKTLTDLILMQQGDRGIFEFNYKYPGEFMFHSHINHFTDLGWVGFFNVTKSN